MVAVGLNLPCDKFRMEHLNFHRFSLTNRSTNTIVTPQPRLDRRCPRCHCRSAAGGSGHGSRSRWESWEGKKWQQLWWKRGKNWKHQGHRILRCDALRKRQWYKSPQVPPSRSCWHTTLLWSFPGVFRILAHWHFRWNVHMPGFLSYTLLITRIYPCLYLYENRDHCYTLLGFIGASVCLMCLSSSRPQEISGKVSWTSNELTRMKPMGVSFGLIIPAVMKV